MKKLLILLALCMVLSVVLVACDTPEQPVDETTEGTTEAPTTEEPTTEAPTTEEPTTEEPTTEEPTTEEPTTEESTTEEQPVEPVDVVAGFSFDAMGNVYGGEIDMENLYFASYPDFTSWSKVAEIDHLVDSLKVAGWVAFFTETEGVLGYAIDGAAAVYPEGFSTPAGQDVLDHIAAGNVPGAVSAARMFSDVPVKDLAAGEHTIALMAKDAQGNEEAFAEFTLVKVDNSLKINLSEVAVSGSYPTNYNGSNTLLQPIPAVGADEYLAILHYGSINLGEVDLSKYSKVTVTYANMAGAYDVNGAAGNYDDEYNATQKRVMLTNTASGTQEGTAFELTPADDAIIAFANYEKSEESLVLRTVTIDLTEVEYNGQTYLTFDFRNAEGAFGYVANLIVVTGVVFE